MSEQPPPQPPNGITIINFKPLVKGTLRGFATVRIDRMRMTIKSVGVFEKNGKRWVTLPSRTFQGENGKPQHIPQIEFTEKRIAERFKDAVFAALAENQNRPVNPNP